jgi:hypothetical protein
MAGTQATGATMEMSFRLLQNKFGIIFGVANKCSIAWATA